MNANTHNWPAVRMQLLAQWSRLTASELDRTGGETRRIARLVGRKYGIGEDAVDSYLRHFERIMPPIH